MDPVTQARMFAMNTTPGTVPHNLAIAICQIRGINPDYPSGQGLPNWQGVIMETLLIDALRTMVPR